MSTAEASTAQSTATPGDAERPPKQADGLELIGEYEDSGFKEPPSIARRSDGQVIQLPRILYLVAEAADGSRGYDEIASRVSEQIERSLDGDSVRMLVEEKLRPLGVLTGADGTSPQFEKPDPLLALRFRASVVPAHAAERLGRLFRPLFFPPVELAVLVGVAALDVWLFGNHGIAQALRQSLNEPAVMLVLLAAIILAAGFHEFGHAAGCTAGGACPGDMGAGLYMAWPAFYTDVTDAYRLDKRGRLRTDLAGVYFNLIFMLVTAGVYFATHFEPLLLIILVQHIEIVHQLLPLLRLDGYYIMADLTGVPDLYQRIGAILISALPWRRADERVTALKPWVRVVVTFWVLLIVPALLLQLVTILVHLPRIAATAFDSTRHLLHGISHAFAHGDALSVAVDILQLVILVLPLVGIGYSLIRIGSRTFRGGWRQTEGKPVLRVAFVLVTAALLGALIYSWRPAGNYEPIHRGERGTLTEGIAAIRRGPLVPYSRARERGQLGSAGIVPTGSSTATTVATTTASSDTTLATTTTLYSPRGVDRATSTTLRRRTPTTTPTSPNTVTPTTG